MNGDPVGSGEQSQIEHSRAELTTGRPAPDRGEQQEAILRHQRQLLRGAAEAAHQLLSHPDYDRAINAALQIVGPTMGVSRIYIFENLSGFENLAQENLTQENLVQNNLAPENSDPGNPDPGNPDPGNPDPKISPQDDPAAAASNTAISPISAVSVISAISSVSATEFQAEGQVSAGNGSGEGNGQGNSQGNSQENGEGDRTTSCRFLWADPAYPLALDAPILQQVSFRHELADWYDRLMAGERFSQLTRHTQPLERRWLVNQSIHSLMTIPIQVNGQVWGFITVADCHHERSWSIEEESMLLIVASGIGGLLERQQSEQVAKQQYLSLEHARLEAEQASQMKSAFFTMMSHEIRTPMNAVMGMTGLLMDTPLTAEQQECVDTIRANSDNLLTLMNSILDISKLESGAMQLENLNFNLQRCIEEIADLMAPKAYQKGLDLTILMDQNSPCFLYGDVGRLRQILTSLVDNAIKFTESGAVSISVALKGQTATHASLVFAVEDTGIGLNLPNPEQIFHPFFQVDSSITRKYSGSGLGLAISKQLTRLMGGELKAENRSPNGAKFWFALTFGKRNIEGDLSQLSQGFPGIKSLIISPVASLRQVLTHDALGLHMHPTAVEHWQEALHGLQTGAIAPPDLVICHLPPTLSSDATSLSSLQREPSLAATRWLAVVSTTQLAMGQTLIGQSLMSQGFAAYVSQPIKPSRLKESVAIALGIGNDQRPLIGPISMTPGGLSDSDIPVDETKAALKILLVEDNVINQKLTLKQLTNLGYRADVVADGQEAVDAISQIAYDLVLMDCQMPVMDGYNATLAIRQLEEQRQANQQANQRPAVIIAMTANVLPEDRDRALAVGMNDYLPKPVSQETLAAVLVRWSHTILEGQAIAPSPAQNPADCPMSPDHLRQQMDLQMDWELLYQLSEGCAEFETELLQLFVDDSRVYLERLERAISDRNFHQVEQAAHHIKGASANIGAKRLQAAADQLEQQSRQQQLLNAAELLTELKSSLNCIHWFVKTQTLPNQTRSELG